MIVISFGILSCSNTSGNVDISPTPKFELIPYAPGESPMVPHPQQSFEECDLCHIDSSSIGSFIKIHKEHSCDECHMNLDYEGPCQEDDPVNITCRIDVCHQYP
jgi:hypothetical protein